MAKSTYEDYSNALKEKDAWTDVINNLYDMSAELTKYASGNAEETVRSLMEEASNMIIVDKVWQGADAIACANAIWDIRNEAQNHSNFIYDARKKLVAAAEERQHEAQKKVDRINGEMGMLGDAERDIRSFFHIDHKRK